MAKGAAWSPDGDPGNRRFLDPVGERGLQLEIGGSFGPLSVALASRWRRPPLPRVAAGALDPGEAASAKTACWRNGQRCVLRDLDGSEITPDEGRAICAARYKIDPAVRAARRKNTQAKAQKGRTGRRKKESTETAPASGPSPTESTPSGHEAA